MALSYIAKRPFFDYYLSEGDDGVFAWEIYQYVLKLIEDIRERFKTEPIDLKPNYNVAPTQDVAVIINEQLALFRWGLIPFWAKDPSIGHKMINARAETVDKKPSFKHSLQRKRCLIVTDEFYE